MIEGKNNLKDFLGERFSDYREEPSGGLWTKIQNKLDSGVFSEQVPTSVNELEEIFKDYSVSPSDKVWNNISKVLDSRKFSLNPIITSMGTFISNLGGEISLYAGMILVSVILLVAIPQESGFNDSIPLNSMPANNQRGFQQVSHHNASFVDADNATTSKEVRTENQIQQAPEEKNVVNAKQDSRNKDVRVKKVKHNGGIIPIKNSDSKIPEQIILEEKASVTLIDNSAKLLDLAKMSNYKFFLTDKSAINKKVDVIDVDLQEKLDHMFDTFYRDWAKKFNRSVRPVYFEIYLLPHYTTSEILKINNNSFAPNVTSKEYMLASPGTRLGMNLGYCPRKTLVEIGLGYEGLRTQRDDRFSWLKSDTTYNLKQDSVGFIFNVKDSTYKPYYQNTYDTAVATSETVKNFSTKYTYHLLEVPLMAGYLIEGEKHILIIKGGVIASYLIATNNEITTLDEDNNQYVVLPEKRSISWSVAAAVSYNYYVTDRLYLSTTPILRYYLTSLYKDVPLKKNPVSIGLSLGVKYLF